VRAGRGCPAPEPGTNGRTVAVQPPLCRGRDEGTATFLGRRRPPHRLAAIATSRATEPPYVCGAGTSRLHRYRDMTSAHRPRRRHRQHKQGDKIPLTGRFCLLTTGGLIRVRWGPPVPLRYGLTPGTLSASLLPDSPYGSLKPYARGGVVHCPTIHSASFGTRIVPSALAYGRTTSATARQSVACCSGGAWASNSRKEACTA